VIAKSADRKSVEEEAEEEDDDDVEEMDEILARFDEFDDDE
jgi:hypothetical protein